MTADKAEPLTTIEIELSIAIETGGTHTKIESDTTTIQTTSTIEAGMEEEETLTIEEEDGMAIDSLIIIINGYFPFYGMITCINCLFNMI